VSVFVANGTVRHTIEPTGTVSPPNFQATDLGLANELFSPWLQIKPYVAKPAPDLTRVVYSLIGCTGWSNRTIAGLIGTTHPTIQAIKKGRELERRPELAEALFKAAEVVEKLSRLAEGDQARLNSVLKNPGADGQTPLRLLSEGAYATAYLKAMDLLGRPRRAGGLLKARWTRQPSEDVGLVFDDSDE
jgi:hypothetical protein